MFRNLMTWLKGERAVTVIELIVLVISMSVAFALLLTQPGTLVADWRSIVVDGVRTLTGALPDPTTR